MNQIKLNPFAFSALDPKAQAGIKDAVKLLILLFWGQGGQKDWLKLVLNSHETWKSLANIHGLKNLAIIQTVDDLMKKYPSEMLQQELESEFVKIFINTRSGVSAPLYHSCYHGDENILMNKPALEMADLLEQAGIDLDSGIGEPPDHLCIELEYLFFLLNHPHVHSDPDLQEYIQMFTREFMLPWIDIFQQRIPVRGVSVFFSHSALAMRKLLFFIGRGVQT